MLKTKEAVNRCPNYHKIMNFQPEPGDFISKKIIHYYREYVSYNTSREAEEIKKIMQLDEALANYIQKEKFYWKIQVWFQERKIELEESNYFIEIISCIGTLYQEFKEQKNNQKIETKWL